MNTNDTFVKQHPTSAITLGELRETMADGKPLVLAEILPRKYYDSGHLPGAVHLPLEGFETIAMRVLPDASARIVVYCASVTCANSDVAARKLAELGYEHVRVFRGGKAAWSDAGFPLEGGA
jgi:rhodanese-related sulfurtransferase